MPLMSCPCIALARLATVAVWLAIVGSAAARQPTPIAHGAELTARHVGPDAAGLSPIRQYAGGELQDGRDYPFARKIERGGIYDGFRVEGPHLLIERVFFTGPIDIYVRLPVVVRGVTIRTRTGAHWALHTRPEAGPVLILWSLMRADSPAGAPADRRNALSQALYLRSERVTVYRSHLTQAADGIQIHAPGARVIETLIDDLVYWDGDHNDGIQMLGRGTDAEIVRSRIVNPNPQTSALNLIGERVLVADSYLSGGGWTLYAGAHHTKRVPGSTKGVVIRGNVFGRDHFPKGGQFGPVTGYDGAGSGNDWSGNRWIDGAPINIGTPPPAPASPKR